MHILSSFWQKLHRIQLLIKSKVERFIAQPRHPLQCSTKIAAFKFGIAASSSSHHNNHSPPCHVSCVLPVMSVMARAVNEPSRSFTVLGESLLVGNAY